MIMVPPEFFNRMNESKPPIPTSSENISSGPDMSSLPYPTNNLDGDMNQVLNKTNLNDREKWSQYYQILQRYFHQNKVQRQPVQLSINETHEITNTLPTEDIVSAYPLTLQRNAERLLSWIKRSNAGISWDDRGIVKINGAVINGSNIVDLIGDLLRHRRTAIAPTGIGNFMQSLRETNVPEELIGNKDRWRQQGAILENIREQPAPRNRRGMGLPPDIRLPSTSQLPPSLQSPASFSGYKSEPYALRFRQENRQKKKWEPYTTEPDDSDS